MNDLQIFNNPDFGDIRIVERDGEPWFVGKDIAQALGYSNPSKAVLSHVDEEDKCFEMLLVSDSQNGNLVKTALVNESGVYSLIFSSKLEKAQQFKRWVTAEVLPSIRKTGAYMTPAAESRLEQLLEAKLGQLLDSKLKGFQDLADRVTALEDVATDPFAFPVPALPAPPPKGAEPDPQPPGRDYLKRWMRTASEKLNLMSSRFNMSNNAILSRLYRFLEEEYGVVLADERIRIMEEYGLEECSTLKAIFYDEEFRDYLEETIDHNLAPENRGW